MAPPGLRRGPNGAAAPSAGGSESCSLRTANACSPSPSAGTRFTQPQLLPALGKPGVTEGGVDLGDRDHRLWIPTGCVSGVTLADEDQG